VARISTWIASLVRTASKTYTDFVCLPLQVKVGNQDIIDVINESIKRFEKNGRVGSKGIMGCQDGSGREKIGGDILEWGVTRTWRWWD
jgi:hypothetical protein